MTRNIGQDRYFSITEAAKRIGVSRMTVYRWITQGLEIDGEKLDAVRDRTSGQLYLAENSVNDLMPQNRFVRL